MGLRPRYRDLVVWNSSAVPDGKPAVRGRTRRTRIGRIRWWLRTGALLTIIGVLWLVRTARTRWEPVFLVGGTVVTVAGLVLPATGAFFIGLLVLIVTLLRGVARGGRATGRRERD